MIYLNSDTTHASKNDNTKARGSFMVSLTYFTFYFNDLDTFHFTDILLGLDCNGQYSLYVGIMTYSNCELFHI